MLKTTRGMSAWTDLDRDGRRLERVIKFCETMISDNVKVKDNDLILAYIDRLIKASNQKLAITDMVLGIKMLRRIAEKQYIAEVTHDKLVELKSK